jgi:DNA-binding NarL/FixJ family response regulator
VRGAVALRVLITDDDPVARAVLQRALDADGIEVVGVAEDGLEAIALAQESRPDVVLMDVVMDRLDGVAATRRLVALDPGIDCVLLTASPEAPASLAGLAAGAAAYLPKGVVATGRLPATLKALRGDEASVARRRARRLVLGLRDAWPGLLEDDEWHALELTVMGEARRPVTELVERLEASEDPRAQDLRALLGG